ncbi:MAG TPA: site-2 protease family protein [Puia sp.]|jgi:Zn-dependent protease
MKSALKIGNQNGFVISVHWTFLPLIAWTVIVNFLTGITTAGVVWSLFLFIGIIASLLLHELGHAVAAGYFNIRATSTILFPFGGISDMHDQPNQTWKYILISLAGPLVNITIGILLLLFIHPYVAYWMEPGNIGSVDQSNFIFQLQVINLSLGLFNLIPVFPMDGGRIVEILFSGKMNSEKANHSERIVSVVVAFAMIALGIWKILPIAFLLGLYILITFRSEKYTFRKTGISGRDIVQNVI